MEITLIFPHQLFKKHPALKKDRKVILVEEWLFFNQFQFHKQKLVLHRATMQYYKSLLEHNGYEVEYISATKEQCDIRKSIVQFAKKKVTTIHYADVADNWLRRRLRVACGKHKIELKEYTTPAFLNTMKEANDYFDGRKGYFQTDFYIAQRKKRNILVEAGKHPVGGKWSYDADNRKKFPKSETVPALPFPKQNEFVTEAIQYVENHFSENPGKAGAPFSNNTFYPATHKEADKWLKQFLEDRFEKFGVYEDAIVADEKVLYHSLLSPLLNTGLLEPADVIKKTLEFASKNNIPLNSMEGFIRQIIGWREYIRIVYEREGRKQRTKNYWNFSRKIPYSFWQGETGIEPVDAVIKRLLECGYTHHIERLMIMGNFMLLCEFDPDEVYRWFMEMYIDAYDWVMVPNIYGMTQFADGGIMVTKPYISSSNYIKKMSNFKKGRWEEIWDALFWRFMSVHRHFFEQNPRIGMLLGTWDKMPKEKQRHFFDTAEDFLKKLDESS
jgi:deoxyribodipyrimidine photolyase-related protein